MDGGVCDNYPFDIVIDAIRKKPASRQVSRELIYLEPDPRAEHEPQIDQSQAPTIVESVRMANSTIRAHVDLQYALADLEEINDRIAQVGKTAEQLMTTLDEESPHAGGSIAYSFAPRRFADLPLALTQPPNPTPKTMLVECTGIFASSRRASASERLSSSICACAASPPPPSPSSERLRTSRC